MKENVLTIEKGRDNMAGFNYIDENEVRRADEGKYGNRVEDRIMKEERPKTVKNIGNNKEEDFEIRYYWLRTL